MGHFQQGIGPARARGKHDDELAAFGQSFTHLAAYLFHAFQIGNGGAAEFLHQNPHVV